MEDKGNARILAVYNSPGPYDLIEWDIYVPHDGGGAKHLRVKSSYPFAPGFVYVGADKGKCWAVKVGHEWEYIIPARQQIYMCETGEVI